MNAKLGINIANYRKENKMTQEDFAARIASRQLEDNKRDYSKSVSKWELGASYPEMKTLILIAEELNLTLDELLYEEVTKYGVSPEIAKEIADMESCDLAFLVSLYEKSILLHFNGNNILKSFITIITLSEDNKNIAFIDNLRFGNSCRSTIINHGDIIENLNYYLESNFEDLLNSPFVVAPLDLSSIKKDDETHTVYIHLLADKNIIKALIDENARRDKIAIERKFEAMSR